MRNRVWGAIGVLWGAGLLLYWLLAGGQTQRSGSYKAGQTGALAFGGLLFVIGLYYLAKSPGKSPK